MEHAAIEHLFARCAPGELQQAADVGRVKPYQLEHAVKQQGLARFLSTCPAPLLSAFIARLGAAAALQNQNPDDVAPALGEVLLTHGVRDLLLKVPLAALRAGAERLGLPAAAVGGLKPAELAAQCVEMAGRPDLRPLAPEPLYCLCRQPQGGRFMIACDGCEQWFHGDCVGVREGPDQLDPSFLWFCPPCAARRHSQGPAKRAAEADAGGEKRARREAPPAVSVDEADPRGPLLRLALAPPAAAALARLLPHERVASARLDGGLLTLQLLDPPLVRRARLRSPSRSRLA